MLLPTLYISWKAEAQRLARIKCATALCNALKTSIQNLRCTQSAFTPCEFIGEKAAERPAVGLLPFQRVFAAEAGWNVGKDLAPPRHGT